MRSQRSRYVRRLGERDSLRSGCHEAAIRQLEIIGEATKRLSPELRSRHPEIDWRRVAGLRDVLVHNYMGVDLNRVWVITQETVPELKRTVETLLTEER
jgi:uncharacterized protein with HEPN domain